MKSRTRLPFWLLPLLLVFLAADSKPSQPPVDKIQSFLDACQRERPRTIARQEEMISTMNRWIREAQGAAIKPTAPSTPPTQFHTPADKQKYLADAEASLAHAKDLLARYRSGKALTPPPLRFPLQSGAIGIFDRDTVRVVQVLGEHSMVVEAVYGAPVAVSPPKKGFFSFRSQPVENGGAATAKVIVRGVPTSDMAANTAAQLHQVFEVAGTAKDVGLVDVAESLKVLDAFDTSVAEARRRK